MGSDIHSIAQVKQDGKWVTVLQDVPGADERNYDTFAVLANLRNGTGFAGIKTGDGFIPISDPKGLPEDILNRVDKGYHLKDGVVNFWLGSHDHSWLTFAEIKAYFERHANSLTKKTGFVEQVSYFEMKEKGKPTYYCGGISGPDIFTIKAHEYEVLKEQKKLPIGKKIYINVEWSESYAEATDVGKILDTLKAISKQHNVRDDEVRIVFGFDS